MKLLPSRRFATLSCLVTTALWIGCSADAGTQWNGGTPQASPDDKPVDEAEAEEEDDAGDPLSTADAAKPKADAGKKKDAGVSVKDASPPPPEPPPVPPPVQVDAGKKDASTPACNTVPVGSTTPVAISGSAPSLNGGTLVDGVYTLTSYKRYISGTSGTTFPQFSMGVSIQGSTLELAGSGGRSNYTFTKGTDTLSLTKTCPSAGTATWDYQASGDTLILYGVPPSNGTWYATFKRQP